MPADRPDALAAAVSDALRAITRLAQQRLAAQRDLGAVVVNDAELRRVLREQHAQLQRTHDEIAQARRVAQRAAERARADGLDDTPYEQTAAGLQRQADVIEVARRQLAYADAATQQNTARAHALLRANGARLDASLREQLQLLARLERVAREAQTARGRG